MSYYGDILRDFNDKYTKSYYIGVPFYLKFKTAPSDSTSVAQSYKISRSSELRDEAEVVTYTSATGVTVKSNCWQKQVATKLKVGNSGETYEVTYKPKDWNNADKALQLKHATTLGFKDTHLNHTESLKFAPPKAGPLRFWLTLDFLHNSYDKNRALKGSANVNFEDYHVGAKFEHDAATHKTKSLLLQAVYKKNRADYFLLADTKKQLVTLGCHHAHGDRATHAYSAVYDVSKSIKGVFGQSALINFAGDYQVSDRSHLKVKLEGGQDWTFGSSWIHQFNNQFRLTLSDVTNVSQILRGGSAKGKSPYSFGVGFQVSL
jgi:hypothetical protein